MNNPAGDPSKISRGPAGPVDPDPTAVDPEDDFRLVALAQKGDTRAYDALVTRHRGRIFAMIRNMIHQEADAWDLSQDVFIKAWHALPKFEGKARFSTWLYRIAHNVVYDWTRKRKIESVGELNDEIFDRNRIDPAAVATPSVGESPDDSLAHGELRAKIEAALAKISPDHREVVVLKDVQGLSYKEIAEVMECTLGTVMSRLFYARQKLQILLKDEYDSPMNWKLALWLDDELAGVDKTAMDLWAENHPEQLAARDEIRRWRSGITATLPASVEPPYPDFFNSRVAQAIRDQTQREPVAPEKKPFWKSFFVPAAACAGMALAFWTGTQSKPASSSMAAISPPDPAPPEPAVYTPENGVDAKWFSSREASATVIVLQGVNAIPDSTDFSETVYVPMSRESESTAGGTVKPETETPE